MKIVLIKNHEPKINSGAKMKMEIASRAHHLLVSILVVCAVSFLMLGSAYGTFEDPVKTDETSGPRIVQGKLLQPSQTQNKDQKKTSYASGRIILKLKSSIPRAQSSSSSALSLSEFPSNLRALIQNRPASSGAKMELVFKHKANQNGSKPAKTQSLQSMAQRKDHGLDRIYKLKLDPSENIESLCQDIFLTGEVEYCEPDYEVKIQSLPNDTYIDPDQNGVWSKGVWGQDSFNSLHPEDLWGLKKIKAAEAWDAPGNSMGEGVIVAVTDTGVDYEHEDLTEDTNANGVLDSGEDQNGNGILDSNIWINTGEIPDNNIDDDGNGYIDDTRGWDFITFDGTSEDNDPMDDHGHGTHVSGTIAAIVSNNRGIAGAAPKAKIMALKGLNQYGSGSLSDLSNAILYAADNGAHVINASWGGQSTAAPQVLIDVVDYAHDVKDVVFVAAAGNSNQDVTNAYFGGFFPASIRDAVTVSAFDSTDTKASFSNFGMKIDVAAPGGGDTEPSSSYDPFRSILSLKSSLAGSAMTGNGELIVGTNYIRQAGTSMAAPHVAGVTALIRSLHPEYSAEQVRQVLRKSSDDIGAVGFDTYSGYGRINALNIVNAGTPLAVQITEPSGTITGVDQISIKGTVNGPGLSFWNLEYGVGTLPSTWTQIASGSQSIINDLLVDWNIAAVPDETYTLRLTAQNTAAQTFEDRVLITIDQIVITEPIYQPFFQPLSIFRSGQVLSIKGTVNPANFESYDIQIFDKDYTLLSLVNVTLANGGLQKVRNDLIATWDTANIPSNFYIIRLNVHLTNGLTSTDVKVGVDPTLHEGWPIPVGTPGFITNSFENHLNTIDLDRNGAEDLMIGYGNNVRILNHMGQNLAGWPQTIDPGNSGVITQKGVAAGDVDGDGFSEIAVGTNFSQMFVWDSEGIPLPGWPKQTGAFSATLTIEDIDGNGINEFISAGHVFDKDGAYLSGWPRSFDAGIVSPAAVGDVDGDGRKEILTMKQIIPATLYLHDFQGNIMPGWPKVLDGGSSGNVTFCYPLLADIDGDGDLEIISGSMDGWVYAFHHDGSSVAGWPQFTQAVEVSSVTVGDIDGDNQPEVIAGTVGLLLPDPGPFETHLYAWHGDGTLLTGWPVQHVLSRFVAWSFFGFSNMAIADVNGDNKADVVAAGPVDYYNPFPVHAYQFDGTEVSGFPKPASGVTVFPAQTPVVSDMDGDGFLELAWVDLNYRLYMWDLEAPANSPRPWPMFRRNSQHTGVYVPNRAPVILSQTPSNLNPLMNGGGQLQFSVQASDPDNDPLTYEWRLDDVVQSTSNAWVYSPDFNSAGTHTIHVDISDGIATPTSVSWTVTVQVNHPPQITSMSVTSPLQATVDQRFYWSIYVSDPDVATADVHQLTATFNNGQTTVPVPICGSGGSTTDLCVYRTKTIGCDCNDNRTRTYYAFYLAIKPEHAGQTLQVTFTPVEALPNVNPGTPKTVTLNVSPTDASILADMEKVIRDHPWSLINQEVSNPFPGFDLNSDGNINATDQNLMRNIWSLESTLFTAVMDKFMPEVTARVGLKTGDPNYIAEFDVDRNGTITAAADRGRILTALSRGRV